MKKDDLIALLSALDGNPEILFEWDEDTVSDLRSSDPVMPSDFPPDSFRLLLTSARVS